MKICRPSSAHSTVHQLLSDDRKQLQIGTLAPLDVVSPNSAVESDKQALITSQSNLEYQQLVMKQAIARSLEIPRCQCPRHSDRSLSL